MDPIVESLRPFLEQQTEVKTTLARKKYVLAAVATDHDVVNTAGHMETLFSSYGADVRGAAQ